MAPRLRALCTQKPAAAGSTGKEVAAEPTTTNRNKDGVATYTYGESLNLPEVTKEQAENAYLDATDVKRAMTPPISVAVEARDDMLKDRFNYVSKHVNSNQYIVAGGKKVAPAAIGQGSFLIAGFCVLLGAIGTVVYVKTQVHAARERRTSRRVRVSLTASVPAQWGVNSALELGDRLRERGAQRKETLDGSNSAKLVRSLSSQAESTVKENVDL